jgi:hypothetical protein
VLLYDCALRILCNILVGLGFWFGYSVRRRIGNVTAWKPTCLSLSLLLFNPQRQSQPAVISGDHAFPQSALTGFAWSSEQRMIFFLPKQRWIGRVSNEEALHRVKARGNSLHTIKRGKANWIGYILSRNCLKIYRGKDRRKDRSDGKTRKKS